jgi:hypothetical protein
MYLAESSPLTTPAENDAPPVQAVTDYARALRAIGQDLSALFPKTIEIDTDGVAFKARGRSHANPFHQIRPPALKRLWSKLFGKERAADTADDGQAFARNYSWEDIERLDQLYSAHRSGHSKRPDNYSLPERLRMMGAIVNTRKGRLKQLRKDRDRLTVDYWDTQGTLQSAKLTTVILYRNQHIDLATGDAPKELWEGYDF